MNAFHIPVGILLQWNDNDCLLYVQHCNEIQDEQLVLNTRNERQWISVCCNAMNPQCVFVSNIHETLCAKPMLKSVWHNTMNPQCVLVSNIHET